MIILTGLFTVITTPVIAQRVGQLAFREQNLQSRLVVDESGSQFESSEGDDRA